MKKYRMEQIVSIGGHTLSFTDTGGEVRTLDLARSRDLRWAISHGRQSFCDRLFRRRRRCRVAADCFWGFEEAYFKFYTPKEQIMFAIDVERQGGEGAGGEEASNALEARRRFDMLRDMLAQAGWTAVDDWVAYDESNPTPR